MASIDIISEDGILCSIISRLTLKEAVRTCVLSRRWRYIWTHLPKLQFDAAIIFPLTNYRLKISENYAEFIPAVKLSENYAADKFITAVNSFLHQHQGVGVDTFSIQYNLNKIHYHHLDAWVDFAIASKARSLQVHQGTYSLTGKKRSQNYEFPCHLLESSSIQCLILQFCALKMPLEFGGLPCLKSLTLDEVNFTGDDIRSLLSNCYTLEHLALKESQKLLTLSISHPLSELKFLEVICCRKLSKIEIKAINLTFLHYRGRPVEFMLGESLHLTKAVIHFESHNTDGALTVLSNNLPRLRDLDFALRSSSEGASSVVRNSSRFVHLKHLEWLVPSQLLNEKGYRYLAALLLAAPFLEKLTLCYEFVGSPRELKQINGPRPSPHTHLKSVEVIGFDGDMWNIVNAVYILNNAIKLELMTLHRAYVVWNDEWENKSFETGKEYLERSAPDNVRLVFLDYSSNFII